MDLAAMKGGSIASVSTRLLYGKGCRHKAHMELGIPTSLDPHLGSLHCCCVTSEGTARVDEAIPMTLPDFPLQLPPLKEQDEQTCLFGDCKKLARKTRR
jgi:hypothetical protein